MSADPTRPLPAGWQRPYDTPSYQQRGRRFPVKTTIAIVIVLLLAVGADRVAAAVAENMMASRFQTQLDLSAKPSVSIQGFPFLTQLAARDLNTVVVTGHNLTDQQLDLASIDVVAHGLHIQGSNSATIDSLTGSVTVTLASLANAGGVPANITLTPAGPNLVKGTISVPLLGDQEVTARVTQQGSDQVHVQVIDAGGLTGSELGPLADFTVPIPKLPAGVTIQSVSVTSAGVQVSFAGSHTTLSQ